MNFNLTPEQLQLKAVFQKFADDEIKHLAREIEKKGDPKECIPWPLIEKANSLGLAKATIPKEFGGSGLKTLDIAIIAEELARGDAGFTLSILSNSHFAHIISIFGTEEQKKKWFSLLLNDTSGRILTGVALTEPQSGSDAMSPNPRAGIMTSAQPDGDNYIINGKKSLITNGGLAKAYLVWVRTDKAKSAFEGGLSVFIIPADTPGLSIGKIEDKLGQRLSQQAELIFDNCVISKENMLGRVGMGHDICAALTVNTFTGIGAVAVGITRAAFEAAYDYAKTRIQGGTEIINHQGISYYIADMMIGMETTRTLVQKSASVIDGGGPPDFRLAAMCKLTGSELAFNSAHKALQIFGGYGYTREYPVEKLLRDAQALSVYETGNEALKSNIVQIMRMMEGMKPGSGPEMKFGPPPGIKGGPPPGIKGGPPPHIKFGSMPGQNFGPPPGNK